jgi:hypothetical protein
MYCLLGCFICHGKRMLKLQVDFTTVSHVFIKSQVCRYGLVLPLLARHEARFTILNE